MSLTRVEIKLTLNGIKPTSVRILNDKNYNKLPMPVEEVDAKHVYNVNELSSIGRVYKLNDTSAFRTVGNDKLITGYWIGRKSHKYRLLGNSVILESEKNAKIVELIFANSNESKCYYESLIINVQGN